MENSASPILFRGNNPLIWKKKFHGLCGNTNGQILISWLIVMSLLLVFVIAFGSGLSLIQDRMHLINLCRIESLKVQSEAEPLLKNLLALNPEANTLRILMLAAKARLASALAHYNVPMAARARYEISQIRRKQQALDQTQKFLVKSANISLYTGTMKTYSKLQSAFREIKKRSHPWADIDFTMVNPKIPKLAVQPEDQNLAPAYRIKDDFEKVQSSSQTWSQKYLINKVLKFQHQSLSECHATLEESTWEPKIRRDKLSLK